MSSVSDFPIILQFYLPICLTLKFTPIISEPVSAFRPRTTWRDSDPLSWGVWCKWCGVPSLNRHEPTCNISDIIPLLLRYVIIQDRKVEETKRFHSYVPWPVWVRVSDCLYGIDLRSGLERLYICMRWVICTRMDFLRGGQLRLNNMFTTTGGNYVLGARGICTQKDGFFTTVDSSFRSLTELWYLSPRPFQTQRHVTSSLIDTWHISLLMDDCLRRKQ